MVDHKQSSDHSPFLSMVSNSGGRAVNCLIGSCHIPISCIKCSFEKKLQQTQDLMSKQLLGVVPFVQPQGTFPNCCWKNPVHLTVQEPSFSRIHQSMREGPSQLVTDQQRETWRMERHRKPWKETTCTLHSATRWWGCFCRLWPSSVRAICQSYIVGDVTEPRHHRLVSYGEANAPKQGENDRLCGSAGQLKLHTLLVQIFRHSKIGCWFDVNLLNSACCQIISNCDTNVPLQKWEVWMVECSMIS